ncbi:MAG TPA: ABC transporter permease [Bryobacteraceae bacterium]|nr:ABC transporter permease [Bryobacteraceae bacterium]
MITSLKHAFRVLRKDPGFTFAAICSLALGIGATSAMFSFADALLLRPLPVGEPDRVVAISAKSETSSPVGVNTALSYPDYADFRDRNRSFEGVVAASGATLGFSPRAGTLPRVKLGQFVSGNFFRVLGVEPVLGRGFRADEDQVEGRDAVVVLSHDFWVSQFGANPSVLGSRIRLNGTEFTVIGVAPASFTGMEGRPAVYVPLAMAPRLGQSDLNRREVAWVSVRGRLRPGVSVEQARADIGTIAAGIEQLHPQDEGARRIQVQTEFQLRIQQSPPTAAMVIMLAILALAVLAVACANVAGLLLSRARARSREIAVRLAIGASRGALVRQLLLENLVVAVAGGLAGVAVAEAGAEFFAHIPFPTDLGWSITTTVDGRVLLFTLLVSVVSTLLFGLAPALRVTRPDLVPALKATDADSGGKRRLWGRNTIVAGQVALSLVLLVLSAVLVEGFRHELAQGVGFRPDRLFITSFDTQLTRYSEGQSQLFYKRLLERTRATAGVRSAALASSLPLWSWDNIGVVPEGYRPQPGEQALSAYDYTVSEGYFSTLGVRLLHGRALLESDGEGAPLVAVVNDHLANHFWPKGDALGKRFHLSGATGPLVEIVGIARAAKTFFISEPPADVVYLPFRQHAVPAMTLVAESDAPDAATLAPVLREVVQGLDANMPVFYVRTMQEFYTQRAVTLPNMTIEIVAGLGLMGLLLAVVGLYGLVAYSVSRRTREIGIRIAVGADPGNVIRMVLRQGLTLGAAGVAAGLVVSLFACRAMTSATWFFSFDRVNPAIFVAIPTVLLAVTALAAWAPARRASRVDPMRALRDE